MLRDFRRVVPLYIRSGLRWESAELASLRRFLAAVERPGLDKLVVLEEPIADVYGDHWSTSGPSVPGSETPDAAVYLPGRNLLLTTKAAVWCRLREIEYPGLGQSGIKPVSRQHACLLSRSRKPLEPGDGRQLEADPAL